MSEALLTEKDVADGKQIAEIFEALTEETKSMAMGYLSALSDKAASERESK